jgi:hypothetical protein
VPVSTKKRVKTKKFDAVQRAFISMRRNSLLLKTKLSAKGESMQRRVLLKFASGLVGIAAGLTVLAASANAAPLAPVPAMQGLQASRSANVESAVVTQADVDQAKPVQVRWHHHGGWHRHHWRRHHWHRHHWHRHHWHHRR